MRYTLSSWAAAAPASGPTSRSVARAGNRERPRVRDRESILGSQMMGIRTPSTPVSGTGVGEMSYGLVPRYARSPYRHPLSLSITPASDVFLV